MRRLGLLLVALAVLACASSAQAATRVTIRGAGFGHGIGMSQYGAYGLSLQGVTYPAILARYYTGTALAVLSPAPEVRVLLQGGRGQVSFSGVARVGTRALNPARTYNVVRGAAGLVLRRGTRRVLTTAPPLRVDAPAGVPLRLFGTSTPGMVNALYRGALELRPGSRGINVINAVALEDYVRGVVSAESPATWPAEALKAQAVAARTYAITSRAGSISDGFDQYADTRSQMYRGVAAERPTTDFAVVSTAGQVVTYAGVPAVTFFFSTSGGRTENVENSFIGSPPKPWLQGVDDPYDDLSPKHRWGPIRLTGAQAAARLRGLVRGTFRRIRVLQRGTSPRIVRALVVGSRGTTPVTGPMLRARFGLFDTWAFFTSVSTTARRTPIGPQAPTTPVAPTTPPATAPPVPTGGVAASLRAVTSPVVAGRIAPARRGARIRVERRTRRGWRLAVDAQLGARGRYAVPVARRGVYRVRYGRNVVGPAVRVR